MIQRRFVIDLSPNREIHFPEISPSEWVPLLEPHSDADMKSITSIRHVDIPSKQQLSRTKPENGVIPETSHRYQMKTITLPMKMPVYLSSKHSLPGSCCPLRGLILNFFFLRIPVELLTAPVRLRCHNADNRMGKTVIDRRCRLRARLHCLQPRKHVFRVIIVGSPRRPGRGARDFYDFLVLVVRSNERQLAVNRIRFGRVDLMRAAFLTHGVKRGALAAVAHNGPLASLNTRESAITVSERSFIRVEKAFRIGDCGDAGIRIFALIFPDEHSAVGDDTLGVSFVRINVHQIAPMAHPLIKNT